MPGIRHGFDINFGEAPLQLVLGPNGIGKSSLSRTIQRMLWPQQTAGTEATGYWEHEKQQWRCDLTRKVHWFVDDEQHAPPDPAAELSHVTHLGLRDLLSANDNTIADEIMRQMAGGFDLQAWRQNVPETKDRLRRKAVARLESALAEVTRLRRQQRQTADRADEIPELEKRRKTAREAAERVQDVRRALELDAARERAAQLENALRAFPENLTKLHGNEIEQLDDLLKRTASDNDALRDAKNALTSVKKKTKDLGPVPNTSTSELATLKRRLTDADALEKDVRNAATRLAELKCERDNLEQRCGIPLLPTSPVSSDELNRIDEAEAQREAEHKMLRELLTRLPRLESDAADEDPTRLDAIERACAILRNWDQQRNATPAQPIWQLLVPGAVGALLLVAALIWSEWFALLSAPFLFLCAYLVGTRQRQSQPPDSAYNLTGQSRPDGWGAEAVRARLAELEEQSRPLVRARDARRDLSELERQVAYTKEQLQTSEKALKKSCAEAGIETLPDPLPAPGRITETLNRWATITEQVAVAEAKADEKRDQVNRALSPLLKQVAGLVHEDVADLPEALSIVEELQTRLQQHEELQRRTADLDARIEKLTADVEQDLSRQRLLLTSAGYDADEETSQVREQLRSDLTQLEDFTERRRELQAQEIRVCELTGLLHATPELAETPQGELETIAAELQEQASQLEPLTEEITTRRHEREEAEQANTFSDALEEEQRAKEALADLAASESAAIVQKCIADYVISTYEGQSRPPLLTEADRLFARFTHGAYRLHTSGVHGHQANFSANDTRNNRRLSLDELSDGTRIQLLIAVRLAYLKQCENSLRLPLLLDEALTTCDPQRFPVIAATLAEVAKERQVIYFSSNPLDAESFKRACAEAAQPPPSITNLAQVRGQQQAATPELLKAPPMTPVPKPGNSTPKEYAVLLSVPAPDLHDPVSALDIFFLLRDQLNSLYKLRCANITCVGQYVALDKQAVVLMLDDAVDRLLNLRITIARTVHQKLRVGHPPPLTRDDIETCDAITDAFIEKLASLLDDVNGDAARFIKAIDTDSAQRDERAKGFRSQNAAQLRDDLEARGFIDDRTPCALSEMIEELLRVPRVAAAVSDNTLTLQSLTEQVKSLRHAYGLKA